MQPAETTDENRSGAVHSPANCTIETTLPPTIERLASATNFQMPLDSKEEGKAEHPQSKVLTAILTFEAMLLKTLDDSGGMMQYLKNSC